MKKLLKYFLTVYVLLAVGSASFVYAGVAAAGYGNNSENILNGGVLAADASGHVYYANTDKGNALYVMSGDSSRLISKDPASNINVIGNTVYYTTKSGKGSAVYSVTTAGKNRTKLFTSKSVIEEMYVSGDGTFYYLTKGTVYQKTASGKAGSALEKGNITHFIPTAHGMIVAKGSARNYTVLAEGKTVAKGVFSFYTSGSYLIFTKNEKDYQVKIHDLFNGFTKSDIKKYTLGNGSSALSAIANADDDDCEECKANAKKNPVSAAAEKKNSVSANGSSGNGSSGAAKIVSILNTNSVSQGQKNMVKRARQQHEIKWTPVANIKTWGGSGTFVAGTTYNGLPYGQPVKAKYVPWQASLEEFVNAVNDAGSLMYTSRSYYNRTAPYYSCDCSSFVSWSWDLPSRQWTRSIGAYATVVESQSIYSAQVGDALCKAGSHVVMISDVGYRGDDIVYIDIMEQTPPQTKYTRWGEGGTKALSELYAKYFGKGYVLIRSKTRDSVSFKASSAVVIDGIEEGESPNAINTSVTLSDAAIELGVGEEKKLTYQASVTGDIRWSSDNSGVATAEGGLVKAVSAGKAKVTLSVGSISSTAMVYVRPAQAEITSVTASTSGVKIKWNTVAGADAYQVLRKDATGAFAVIATAAGKSYTDRDVAVNSSYTYSVRAVLNKADGNAVCGAYNTTGVVCRTVTDTPVLKSVKLKGAASHVITWKAVAGAEGYSVYKKSAKTKWAKIADTKKTTYTAENLTPDTTYSYTVRAYFTANGKQVYSDYNKNGVSKKAVPAAPVLSTAAASSKKQVLVKWKKVSGISTYKVYRKDSTHKKWTEVGTTYTNRFLDKNVDYQKKYTYTVRAMYRYGVKKVLSGFDKNGVSVSVWPGKPEVKSAASEKSGQAQITWSKAAGAHGYYVYVKQAGGKWTQAAKCNTKTTSVTLKKLTSGAQYAVAVRAYWSLNGKIVQSKYDSGVKVTVK